MKNLNKNIDRSIIPKGTILGPLLYILYVNDLLKSMTNEFLISYADDTAEIASDTNWITQFKEWISI